MMIEKLISISLVSMLCCFVLYGWIMFVSAGIEQLAIRRLCRLGQARRLTSFKQ
jgi:hypothetical protein